MGFKAKKIIEQSKPRDTSCMFRGIRKYTREIEEQDIFVYGWEHHIDHGTHYIGESSTGLLIEVEYNSVAMCTDYKLENGESIYAGDLLNTGYTGTSAVYLKDDQFWIAGRLLGEQLKKYPYYKVGTVFDARVAEIASQIKNQPKDSPVDHPEHYTSGDIECIDAIDSAVAKLQGSDAVYTAQIMKYIWRWRSKNGTEDLEKAKWYLERLIDTQPFVVSDPAQIVKEGLDKELEEAYEEVESYDNKRK